MSIPRRLFPLLALALFCSTLAGQETPAQRARSLLAGKHRPNRLLVRLQPGRGIAGQEALGHLLRGRCVASLRLDREDPDALLYCYELPEALDAVLLEKVLADPSVLYAEPDYLVHHDGIPNDADFGQQWGLHNTGQSGGSADADIDAVEAWDVSTGSASVVVAIIDSGIDAGHADLTGNLWINPGEVPGNGLDDDGNGYVDDIHGYDFVRGDGQPNDEDGHGTHVAGIIGAVGNDGVGQVGVNWDVSLMALKFLDGNGEGYTSDAIAALIYARDMGAQLANSSWGGPDHSQALEDAIAGFDGLHFSAAGNEAENNELVPSHPANARLLNNLSIAGSDRNDTRYVWSNFGMNVHLAAPGVDIRSSVPGGGYAVWSGTSMATPHATGVAALVLARYPNSDLRQLRARLLYGVDVLPIFQGWILTGGRLNAANALSDDIAPPAAPNDLTGAPGDPDYGSVDLVFTTTGDDGSAGDPSGYDVRFSTSSLDATNFASATPVAFYLPATVGRGGVETIHVPGLLPNTTYWFGVRVEDEAGNASALAVTSVTTADALVFFEDDFESGNLNAWASADAPWGVTGDAQMGSFAATDSPAGQYPDNGTHALTTPAMDMRGVNQVYLTFHHKFSFEDGWDFGHVEVSGNGGGSWTTLASYTGQQSDFAPVSLDLSAWAGNAAVVVRFAMDTDYAIPDEGWTIDGLLIFGETPVPTTSLAFDGFESNNYSGGVGWSGNWTASGDISLLSSSGPHSGSRHVRLRRNSGYLERGVDLTGQSNVRLQFWAKVESFEGSDAAQVLVSSDGGGNWTVVQGFSSADSDNSYHFYDIDLAGFALNSQFRLAFDAQMSGRNDRWYVDDIELVAELSSNTPPVADDQALTTDEDVSLGVTLTGSDAEGDPLSYSVVSGPDHGSLTGSAPNLSYTPDADYNGADQFSFVVNDGSSDSQPASVQITVLAQNDAPQAQSQTLAAKQDTALALLLTGTDVDGDPLSYNHDSPAHGSLSGTAPNLSYQPDPGYNGLDSFSYTVHDGTLASAPATITIVVAPNTVPVADAQALTMAEDGTLAITLTGSDGDGDPLSFQLVSQPTPGSLSGTAPNLSYQPPADFSGQVGFSFTVSDGSDVSSPAWVSITVDAVNDRPLADAQALTLAEDGALAITLTGSDVDGDALSYAVASGPAHGSLSGSGANLSYQPDPDYNGPDAFSFTASDGSLSSLPATISLDVTAVNDAPTASAQSLSGQQDTPLAITLAGSDVDGDPLSYAIASGPAHGSLSGSGAAWSYTPAAGYVGADAFSFTVSDGTLSSASASVDLSIEATPVDLGPTLRSGSVTVSSDAWTSVLLDHTYSEPVVVATAVYDVQTVALVTRVRNAAGNSFELQVQRTDGSAAAVQGIEVQYLVAEAGVYTVAEHGVRMEASTYLSTVTDGKGAWNAENLAVSNSYTSPVVVGQVMSANDSDFSSFWCRHPGSNKNAPSASGIKVGKHVGEDPDKTRAAELVGVIVVESGSWSDGDATYLAGLGSDSIRGVGDGPPYSYGLTGLPAGTTTAVLSQAAMDGNNGGWAILYGSDPVSSTTLRLAIDEDQANDNERRHTTEQVGFIVSVR